MVVTTSSIEVITPAIVLKISGMLEGKDLNFFTYLRRIALMEGNLKNMNG